MPFQPIEKTREQLWEAEGKYMLIDAATPEIVSCGILEPAGYVSTRYNDSRWNFVITVAATLTA